VSAGAAGRHRPSSTDRGASYDESSAVTVLTTFGPLATKVLGPGPDGRPRVLAGYGSAGHFRVTTAVVDGLADLLELLEQLAACPRCLVVRGEPLPGTDRRRCKRLLHPKREDDGSLSPATFRPAARRWLALDVDGLEPPPGLRWLERPAETAAFLAGRLPPGFRGVGCVLQATAGAGIKPGIRARVWYWCERPVSDAEAGRWLAEAPVDRCLFRAVQPHYTAAPCSAAARTRCRAGCGWCPATGRRCRCRNCASRPGPPRRADARPAPRAGDGYARAALARECAALAATPPGGGATGGTRP
jgi:hypothetical protein